MEQGFRCKLVHKTWESVARCILLGEVDCIAYLASCVNRAEKRGVNVQNSCLFGGLGGKVLVGWQMLWMKENSLTGMRRRATKRRLVKWFGIMRRGCFRPAEGSWGRMVAGDWALHADGGACENESESLPKSGDQRVRSVGVHGNNAGASDDEEEDHGTESGGPDSSNLP